MKIADDIFALVGGTPLVRLPETMREGLFAEVVLKLEKSNPTASAKDRIAKQMLLDAEKSGILKKGATVIEPTSGNTGVGLAAMCAARGYRAIFTMPETMSAERRKLIAAFGAEIVLTEGKLGMDGAVKKAEALKKEIPNAWIAGQFQNPSNPEAHYLTTGPEIYRDTDGKVDLYVASVGTGGTLSGTAKYLKEKIPSLKAYAVEPEGSPLLSKGYSGAHKIQGIGANFVPKTYDASVVDGIVCVSDETAKETMLRLAREGGLLVGISSGATAAAAMEIAKRPENKGKLLVAVLADTGERYLSTLS